MLNQQQQFLEAKTQELTELVLALRQELANFLANASNTSKSGDKPKKKKKEKAKKQE